MLDPRYKAEGRFTITLALRHSSIARPRLTVVRRQIETWSHDVHHKTLTFVIPPTNRHMQKRENIRRNFTESFPAGQEYTWKIDAMNYQKPSCPSSLTQQPIGSSCYEINITDPSRASIHPLDYVETDSEPRHVR